MTCQPFCGNIGRGIEDIGASLAPRRTAEEVDGAVEKERAALEDNALDRIIEQAEQGEVAAVGPRIS